MTSFGLLVCDCERMRNGNSLPGQCDMSSLGYMTGLLVCDCHGMRNRDRLPRHGDGFFISDSRGRGD